MYYSYSGCVYAYPGSNKTIKNICNQNGTSIAAPEVAGFFAQENSYLMTLGNNCGPAHDAPCAPLGRAGPILFAAVNQPHNPFYDITTGNSSNGLSVGFPAVPGYDRATGLGSANMMQLAWAINYNLLAAGSTPPIVAYSGAQPGTLYTGPVTVNFTVQAANRGVAGYTTSTSADPGDPTSEPNPKLPSSGPNPFWDGPVFVKKSSGSFPLTYVPGTCTTVHVRAWDNLGDSNATANASYGPICMGSASQVCHLAVGGCLAGGYQAFSVTCPQVMDFSINGTFVSASTIYNGQEQQAHQYTFVNACLPGTSNCQGFNTSETQVCPIHGGGGGGGGGGLSCTKCGGNKCCPNPDGGKGTVCVSPLLPCPVIH